jgi:FtsP/CotA-like multicopper oxidase with cupredoxin domain
MAAAPPDVSLRLVATDGHILLPGREDYPLYVFGFVQAPVGIKPRFLQIYKGNVQGPAPALGFDEGGDVYLTVTNIGLQVRFDLDDAHTLHWHGFRNPIPLFDGLPEVSIAIPPAADFTYFFRPRDPGTYMFHCHFEDVEHVQMGMNGVVYVRPAQNFAGAGPGVPVARLGGNAGSPVLGYAYNDGNGSTAYDREWAIMLNEIDPRAHDGLELVQEMIWNEYKPIFWIMNSRSYPQTILPNNDPSLPSQPLSSLMQVNEGERGLIRLANLGYEQHGMILPGITMNVVGHDATLLRSPTGLDLSYATNTLYIGPGESRDVVFVAPPYVGPGPYDTYLFRNRSSQKLTNGGAPGLGGMVTEVRVYPAGTVPQQATANQTFEAAALRGGNEQ